MKNQHSKVIPHVHHKLYERQEKPAHNLSEKIQLAINAPFFGLLSLILAGLITLSAICGQYLLFVIFTALLGFTVWVSGMSFAILCAYFFEEVRKRFSK